MSDNHPQARSPRRRGRHAPLIVALVLFGFMGMFWFLAIGGTAALFYAFGWREGVLVAGGFAILVSVLAEFRVSGFEMIFDWLASIVEAVLSVIGAIVSGILSLFGLGD